MLPSTFHYVLNSGFSISEAMNIMFPGNDEKYIRKAKKVHCTCNNTKKNTDLDKEREYSDNHAMVTYVN